jgi:hypothetical protein
VTKQTMGGIAVLLGAVALFAYNAADTIADLQNWHALSTPAIVATLLKQAASVVMSAIGGTMLPQLGNGGST